MDTTGGALYSQGSYGCTFDKPLICKDKQQTFEQKKDKLYQYAPDAQKMQFIDKLITTSEAKIEYTIAEKIRKLPFYSNYFSAAEKICEPAPITQQIEKDMSECNIIQNKPINKFRILHMRFAGDPFYRHKWNLSKFSFVKFMTHFLEGIAIMNSHGIVHRDLHQGNILIDSQDVPRIIDFNLSIDVHKKIEDGLLRHNVDYTIFHESPDSAIVNAIALLTPADKAIANIIANKEVLKNIQSVLGVSINDMKKSLENFVYSSKSVLNGNDKEWFKLYWHVFDSWSAGVNLVVFISQMSLWSAFMKTDFAIHKHKILDILRGLCKVDPRERLTCIKALYMLDPNNHIVRKYGKGWV
jgi:serine/threonine protein kinase